MPIVTDGWLLEPENKGIDQFHVGLGSRLAATAAETWADSPLSQIGGLIELNAAKGSHAEYAADALGNAIMAGPEIAEDVKPAVPRLSLADAQAKVKEAGLDKHLKLPQQEEMPVGQLDLMISRARQRREWEATVERGPDSFMANVLDVGTSFLVGALDPINVATAFIPVMGELRYAKLLEGAATSAANRFAVRGAVGAAQGVVGQGLLEPLNWYAHTQDGRDFGMSDVLRDLMFGAVLGGGMQGAGGGIADVYRARKGKPLYPFAPGEPAALRDDTIRPIGDTNAPFPDTNPALADIRPLETDLAKVREAARNETHFGEPSESGFDPDELAAAYAEAFESHPPSASVMTIDDLPQRAREDAMRGGVASLINGEPVRVGEMLESARQVDPRIAESFDAWHGSPYDFERFDATKIDTGEGAQSYGHGLYFAEHEGTANFYREALTQKVPTTNGHVRGRPDGKFDIVDDFGVQAGPFASKAEADQALSGGATGATYRVRINANREHFLDWDRPLAEQSQFVRDALQNHPDPSIGGTAEKHGVSGKAIYERLASRASGGHAEVSARLREAGIPGIKYADAGSRAIDAPETELTRALEVRRRMDELRAKVDPGPVDHREFTALSEELERISDAIEQHRETQRSRNFVLFDDKAVEITHKNGEPVARMASPPVQPALDRAQAWRDLSTAKPDFDEPQVIAASQEAAKTPAVPTKLDERLAAAEKADAYAKQLYDMFAHRLPEDERLRLDDYIATLDADSDARKLTLQRGAACLFEAGG